MDMVPLMSSEMGSPPPIPPPPNVASLAGAVTSTGSVRDLVGRLRAEYDQAAAALTGSTLPAS